MISGSSISQDTKEMPGKERYTGSWRASNVYQATQSMDSGISSEPAGMGI